MTHSFNVADAEKFGLTAAIVLDQIRRWIAYNTANGNNRRDGRTWTYNSVKAWAKLLPYLTPKQVRKAIDDLVTAGAILKEKFNNNPYDHTLWYALTEEEAICPEGQSVPTNGAKVELPSGASLVDPPGKTLDQGRTKEEQKKAAFFIPLFFQHSVEFQTAWAEWVTYRRESGKPIKPTTAEKQFLFLEKLGVDRAILSINNSIKNQWQGLFEPQTSHNGNSLPPRPNGRYFEQAGSYAGITDK